MKHGGQRLVSSYRVLCVFELGASRKLYQSFTLTPLVCGAENLYEKMMTKKRSARKNVPYDVRIEYTLREIV